MDTELKKVEIKSEGGGKTLFGRFHLWGNDTAYGPNDEFGIITVGVVELRSGQMNVYKPWQIKFVNRWSDEPVDEDIF